MKKTLLATCLALSTGLCALNASAAEVIVDGGTITFNGQIVTTACSLNVADQNQTVTLDDITTAQFSASNELANKPKNFDIVLDNCDSQIHTDVALKFTGPGAKTNGILDSTGTATGVAFKVKQGSTDVPFDGSALPKVPITNGTMTIPFSVDYISTAASQTAGTVASSATFKLSYE